MATELLRIFIVSSILGYMLVNGRPERAPRTACEDVTSIISDLGGTPSSLPAPYEISFPSTGYTPGQTYTIRIRANTINDRFRQFMIQGRTHADDSPAGAFGSDISYQPQCTGDTAAIHTRGNLKRSVVLQWTAPPTGTGCICFRYAVVVDSTRYWANLTSTCINEDPQTPIQFEADWSVSENNLIILLNATVDGEFECSLDGGFFQSCSSGDTFLELSFGAHTMNVRFTRDGYCQPLTEKPLNMSIKFVIDDCGSPGMIENGIVTSNGSVVASIATFTCHFGCELIGDSHSICQHNGTWSNTVPECHPLAPHIITHPIDTSAATPFGAEFTCSAKGCGHLNIMWHRHGNSLPMKAYSTLVTSGNEITSTLSIPIVTIEDAGKYYCMVWANMTATQSKTATLFLSDPPSLPLVDVVSVVNLTLNNYNLTMQCLQDTDSLSYAYRWIKKNGTFSLRVQGINSSSLTILNLMPKDSGDYRCVVSNRTGEISSNYSSINIIASSPIIIKQPDDFNATICSSALFKCTARGFGVIKVTWKRVNYDLPITSDVTEEKSLNELSSTLNFNKIVGYYSGQYYCIAENEAGMVTSQAATLYVQIDPPEIIMPPENITVLPNHTCNLICLSSSFGTLTYDWSKQDGSVSQTAVKSYVHKTVINPLGNVATIVNNLAIYGAQVSDEGWYCCTATNEGGSTTECAWLEVNTIPNITAQPSSKAIRKGEANVTAMSCSVIGMGPIYFRWERYNTINNSWIAPSHRAVNTTSPNLVFSIIEKEDKGVYHCIVTNDDGSIVSDNATIFVYGPPIITSISNYTVSLEGDKVNLQCIAMNDVHANYSLQINWYKGNKLIAPNGILLYNEDNKTSGQLKSALLFDPINRTNGGEYTCRAFNHPELFSELKINLTVEYIPHVTIINQSPYVTNVGSIGVLYCRAAGKPIPTVQWFKDGFPFNPIPSYFQQVLLVPTDTPDTAVYTCVGINYAGNKKYTRSAKITVIVEDLKPCHPLLETPENGTRTVIRINGLAKHISFRCNSGYALIGETLATCNNATWSSAVPVCEKVDE